MWEGISQHFVNILDQLLLRLSQEAMNLGALLPHSLLLWWTMAHPSQGTLYPVLESIHNRPIWLEPDTMLPSAVICTTLSKMQRWSWTRHVCVEHSQNTFLIHCSVLTLLARQPSNGGNTQASAGGLKSMAWLYRVPQSCLPKMCSSAFDYSNKTPDRNKFEWFQSTVSWPHWFWSYYGDQTHHVTKETHSPHGQERKKQRKRACSTIPFEGTVPVTYRPSNRLHL
jgi:hypothetical protein